MSAPPPVDPPASCRILNLVTEMRRPDARGYAPPAAAEQGAPREDLVGFIYLDPYDKGAWVPPREAVPFRGEKRDEPLLEERRYYVSEHILRAHSAWPRAFQQDLDFGTQFPHPLRLGQAHEMSALIPEKQEHNRAMWMLAYTQHAYSHLLAVSAQQQAERLNEIATYIPWATDGSGIALPRAQQLPEVRALAEKLERAAVHAVQHANTQAGVLEIATTHLDILKAKFDKRRERIAKLVMNRILTSLSQEVPATGATDAWGETSEQHSVGVTKEVARQSVNQAAKDFLA